MTPEQDQEYRAEAERMARLSLEDQAVYLAWQRDIAGNSKVRKADREAAGERAKSLERLLKRSRKSRGK